MPENTSNIRVGDTLTVIDHPTYGVIPDGKIGDQHRVTEVVNDVHVETETLGDATPVSTTAHILWFATEEDEPATPARPLIDFSASRYATARQYAEYHVSRVNKPETNEVLRAVRDGKEVDAYALTRAVTDAMRGATTRAGQSMARRQHATEIAHLGHIAHAVIENHADGLPVYAEGDRSRAVEAAKEGIREAQAEVDRLTGAFLNEKNRVEELQAERSTLTQAASDERRRLTAEIDAAITSEASLRRERDEARAKAYEERQHLYLEINEAHAALEYAFGLLSDEQQSRLAGFRDGYAQRANDVPA